MKNFFKKIVAIFILTTIVLSTIPVETVQAATYLNGSRGTQVRYLQQNLDFLGYPLGTIDGIYGNNTKNAVIKLQNELKLDATGTVNDKLNNLIKGTVADIQRYLIAKGYLSGTADGIKGLATGTAFKKLQKAHGYAQNGVVDLQILKDILNDTSVNLELTTLREWVNCLGESIIEEPKPVTTSGNTTTSNNASLLNTAVIKALQILLNAEGGYYTLKEDGILDSTTSNAIKSFKIRYGLSTIKDADDTVDNDTWSTLYSVVNARINSLENGHLDINAMLNYAKLHWNNYNTADYFSYRSTNNDCCNYVSQILVAGGLHENDTWHGSRKYNDITNSFDYIQDFTKYMCNTYNIEYLTNFSISDVEVGDCIISTGGTHIVFVIGVNKLTGQIFFTGHTNDRYYGLIGIDDNNSFYSVSMLEGVLKTSDIRLK